MDIADFHNGGERAKEWTDKVWQGKLRIVQKGKEAAIMLIDNENQLFAVCPVKEGAVEKGNYRAIGFVPIECLLLSLIAVDSSRYFVLRVENAQGSAIPHHNHGA